MLARLTDHFEQHHPHGRALADDEALRTRLLRVLGASVALGDHLVAHPGDWRAVQQDAGRDARPSPYGLQASLLEAVGADPKEPAVWGTGGARAASQLPRTARCARNPSPRA